MVTFGSGTDQIFIKNPPISKKIYYWKMSNNNED